jgi:hypothetical protein
MGRTRALGVCALAALVLAVAAAAADKPKVHLTAADQAAARAVDIKHSDFGAANGWTGGPTKPDLTSSFPCTTYHPKQSDLVITGAAASSWKNGQLELDSDIQVMQTAAMVRLDWQRTVLAPQVVPCLRSALAKELGATAHLDSFARIPFPHVATFTRAFRAVVSVKAGATTVSALVDVVLVGRGRTEINLTAIAPLASKAQVAPAEQRLARLLAARAEA